LAATNIPAKATGNWESTTTWFNNVVPTSADSAYIGATDPPGGIGSPTVTLTASEAITNVRLGYGSPTNGTLNLNGHALTVSGDFMINNFGGIGHLVEGAGGSFTAGSLSMFNGNVPLTLGAADVVTSIDIESGASLTTAATGNITSGGSLSSATINLGADMNLSAGLNVENTGATLNLAGHNLSVASTGTLWLGYFGSSAVTVQRGSPTAGNLNVVNLDMANSQNLALIAGDAITNIDIEGGSSLTTATSGNITAGGSVVSGASLNLGANMSLSNGVNVEGSGSTLNLAGHNFTAGTLWLGYFQSSAVNFNRGSGTPGNLTVTNLDMANGQNLSLIAGDAVTNIDIEGGSSLTTATTANITSGGAVAGATLNLGANFSTTGGLNVVNAGATLNLAGHNLSITTLWLGYFGSSAVTLQRGSPTAGNLTVTNLDISNSQALSLIAGDMVTTIDVEGGATLTTGASGNITGGGNILGGGVLNLGADMTLTSGFNVQGAGTTLNLNNHHLSADSLALGYFGSAAVNFQRGSTTPGTLNLNTLNLGNGQNLTLIAGDTITGGGIMGVGGTGAITLTGGSTLTTVASQNVTCTVNVVSSTFTLGANTNIGNQTVNMENGGIVNLAGHNLAASFLLLGYDGTSTVTLNRGGGTPGTLTLGSFYTGNGQSLTLIAGDTISGGDNGVNVTAGATLTTVATANISNNAVNIQTGGTLNFGASTSIGALSIDGAGSLAKVSHVASATSPNILTTTSVSTTNGGKLDLTNNELLTQSTLANVRTQLAQGQIMTSTAGTSGALGYKANGGTIEVRLVLLGDSDLDGQVNVADLANLAGNFGVTTNATWIQGDFDYNQNVNVADLADLAGNFGKDLASSGLGAASASAAATPAAAVPEPAVSLTAVLVLTPLLRRRRRRAG
jgi:hypothetical protein